MSNSENRMIVDVFNDIIDVLREAEVNTFSTFEIEIAKQLILMAENIAMNGIRKLNEGVKEHNVFQPKMLQAFTTSADVCMATGSMFLMYDRCPADHQEAMDYAEQISQEEV